MQQHLHSRGSCIALRHAQKIRRESRWTLLRQRLRQVYLISADSFRA